MDIMNNIRARASIKDKTIAFPETEDPRVLQAAAELISNEICEIILIGEEDTITAKAHEEDIILPKDLTYRPPKETDSTIVNNLYQRRKAKGMTRKEAKEALTNPFYFGAGLVASGQADGCVAGAVATTGEVIRAAIHNIGLRKGTEIISSTFLMALPSGRVLTYADCGVVPYPNAEQLADIAVESARTHKLLTEEECSVAMLSFSTKGSAQHDATELVCEALKIAQQKQPDLEIDGELQFDAAFVPDVAKRKAPQSKVAGHANTFIFPNLDAGNIAYKITERLGGATATGPILQGLAKPMMDLSRGCSVQDILNAACVAILMDVD
jgi:phosphate acetyltransferase